MILLHMSYTYSPKDWQSFHKPTGDAAWACLCLLDRKPEIAQSVR
jgi:hypothetical protein